MASPAQPISHQALVEGSWSRCERYGLNPLSIPSFGDPAEGDVNALLERQRNLVQTTQREVLPYYENILSNSSCLILLADRDWMDHLEKGGHLTPGSRRELVSNTLVVVHPAAAAGGTGSVSDNMSIGQALSGGTVAMGEPDTVPAGRYARAALEALGLWQSTRRRIIPTESVRAALPLAERGEVDAAIVYRSDAAASGKVRVVARMPVTAHPPIRYQAAIVRGSTADERADFLAYLSSADATPVFSRRGFTLLPGDD